MDRLSVAMVLGFVSAILGGCGGSPDPASLPGASETLVEVGRRLGASLSPADLERLAADESRLLHALTGAERLSLGRGYLRFRIDRPAIVDVAVPDGRAPFWLPEAGFRRLGKSASRPPRRPLRTLVATLRGGPGRARRQCARPPGLGALRRVRPGRGRDARDRRGRARGVAGCPRRGRPVAPYADDARPFAETSRPS